MTRHQAADLLHRRLCADRVGVSLHRRQPGLFRRRRATRRTDADGERLRQRAGRAVVLRQHLSQHGRMARGDRTSGRLRPVGRRRARGRRDAAGDRGRARRSRRAFASTIWRCGCRTACRWSMPATSAIGAGEQVLVSGPSGAGKSTLFRALAGVWPFGARHHHRAERRQGDDPAAAALFPDRAARGGGRLSGRAGHVRSRPGRRTDRRGRPAGSGRPHRRGGALESHAVARRAAAARASRARCCTRRTICSSTRPPPRSTSRRRPRSTACSSSGCRTRPSSRSATARRSPRSTAGGSPSCAKATTSRCARAA